MEYQNFGPSGTLTVVQIEGFGSPEGSLRRKQQIKMANARSIKRTTPPMLQKSGENYVDKTIPENGHNLKI